MSAIDPLFLSTLNWETDYPDSTPDYNCIALKNEKLVNVPCNGTSDFTNGTNYFTNGTDVTKPGLGYICEARVITSKTSQELCHFPFSYQQVTYDSCSNKPVASFNPEGKPWCAIQVSQDGIVMNTRWTLCQDERTIIYDGSGDGYFCPMPFIYDRVYYDYCAKKSHDGLARYENFYWCPDPRTNSTNDVYVYQGGYIGRCTEFLFPSGKSRL
jgi:hypothetical protein